MLRLILVCAAIAVGGAALLMNARHGVSTHATAAQPAAAGPPVASESLDGTWEIVSVIEDGKLLPLETIQETLIKDARLHIRSQLASFTRPNGKTNTLAFVTNPNVSPRTIDIAGDLRVGSRGIYMRDGDVLMICLRGSESESRPTMMASLPGSDTFQMTLQRVQNPPPPPPAPPPPAAEVSPAANNAAPTQERIREMLPGTWGHQNDNEVMRLTVNPGGTFTRITTFKRGFRKLFNQEDRVSGNWRVRDSDVIFTPTASTVRNTIGQVSSFRVTSINESEVLYVDNQTGQRRIEWRLR